MLYFDESGYTGPDLANREQPYFALASIRMTDDEIVRIKKDIGYCEWGKELHFKSMYTNLQGRAMLEKIFYHPLMDENHVLPSFAYKRYCIYANIVNILVETWYYNNGINLYEFRGSPLKTSEVQMWYKNRLKKEIQRLQSMNLETNKALI